jgi:hypothetical protein
VYRLIRALVHASGHPALLIAGAPNSVDPPEMTFVYVRSQDRRILTRPATWQQCSFCDDVHIADTGSACRCTTGIADLAEATMGSSAAIELYENIAAELRKGDVPDPRGSDDGSSGASSTRWH